MCEVVTQGRNVTLGKAADFIAASRAKRLPLGPCNKHVAAEFRQVSGHFLCGAVADCDHGNDGANADDNAQQRED